MQLLHLISVFSAIALAVISADVGNPSPNDGFKCNNETANNQPATVAYCGSPYNAKNPTSFTKFFPANEVGRSPVDHYTCVAVGLTLFKYCCAPDKLGQTSGNPPSLEKVNQYCKKM
ncbi:hypothetical protein PtB15_9B624 [Puccinia triticina]|nr:hypothetical protein PtB15_9B624 [Puccinia triticina]